MRHGWRRVSESNRRIGVLNTVIFLLKTPRSRERGPIEARTARGAQRENPPFPQPHLACDLSRIGDAAPLRKRSEEHTSELQSRLHLVCRLLLEKKNKPNHDLPTALVTIIATLACDPD